MVRRERAAAAQDVLADRCHNVCFGVFFRFSHTSLCDNWDQRTRRFCLIDKAKWVFWKDAVLKSECEHGMDPFITG